MAIGGYTYSEREGGHTKMVIVNIIDDRRYHRLKRQAK